MSSLFLFHACWRRNAAPGYIDEPPEHPSPAGGDGRRTTGYYRPALCSGTRPGRHGNGPPGHCHRPTEREARRGQADTAQPAASDESLHEMVGRIVREAVTSALSQQMPPLPPPPTTAAARERTAAEPGRPAEDGPGLPGHTRDAAHAPPAAIAIGASCRCNGFSSRNGDQTKIERVCAM